MNMESPGKQSACQGLVIYTCAAGSGLAHVGVLVYHVSRGFAGFADGGGEADTAFGVVAAVPQARVKSMCRFWQPAPPAGWQYLSFVSLSFLASFDLVA